MPQKSWDGKNVHFAHSGLGKLYDSRVYELGLTEEAARKLAISLARLKQTTFALTDECEEILQALNYVLVGDPFSVSAQRRMEASKGMEPASSNAPDGTWNASTDPRLRALRKQNVELGVSMGYRTPEQQHQDGFNEAFREEDGK